MSADGWQTLTSATALVGRDKAVRRVTTRLAPLAWGLAGHMMSAQL